MEFLFLVCQQLGCRQLSPSQGGKDVCYMELLGSDFLGRHLPAFHLIVREPESDLETTCLVLSSYSNGFTWEALSQRQNHTKKGSQVSGVSATSQRPPPPPWLTPEVVSTKCQVREEAKSHKPLL